MLQDIKVRVKFDTIGNFGTCQSFSTGCNMHYIERRSPFSRCYCANSYVNNFCRSFVFLVFQYLSVTVMMFVLWGA